MLNNKMAILIDRFVNWGLTLGRLSVPGGPFLLFKSNNLQVENERSTWRG
jgi:hypothetical protein